MSRPRSWTDDQLRHAAATSRSMAEIYPQLGLRDTGGAWLTVRRHAKRLGIALPKAPPGPPRTWTDDQLRRAFDGAPSITAVTQRLGLTQNGQENDLLRRHARRLGLTLPGRSPRAQGTRGGL